MTRPLCTGPLGLCLILLAASVAHGGDGTRVGIKWEKNFLTISHRDMPGGSISVNYLEAYCRPGSTDRDWKETVIGHKTRLVYAKDDFSLIKLQDTLSDGVVVDHTITAGANDVDFRITAHNPTDAPSQAHWAQPCIRLTNFVGVPAKHSSEEYLPKSFIFVDGKLTRMPTQPWATKARYTPGQVWCPRGVPRDDVNPRPLSDIVASNGLIGCFSGDDSWLFATAFEPYQELFQGVIVCLHSDFRIGGLKPGQTKHIHGKIYVMKNNVPELLARYGRDFPEQIAAQTGLPESIAPSFSPEPGYAGKLGDYRSPLLFDDDTPVKSADDWPRRRQEILRHWHALMGPWPPLLEKPRIQELQTTRREGFTQRRIRLEVAPGRTTECYLLVPDGPGPFPAVVVPFYDAESGAGLKKPTVAFGYELTKRGFVSLNLGTPGSRHYPAEDDVQVQPLSYLAYVAANCCTALVSLPGLPGADGKGKLVDPKRIGIVGHSYGGKWAMFAAALDERFALCVTSDPGIVFDEKRSNVNYWEPWYLGYEKGTNRRAGVPTDQNPRTGPYKTMIERGRDLHELHALIAPRPFLVSGGAEDRPQRWEALNHLVAVNRLLGHEHRVAMTNREGHTPTQESNDQLYAFFQHFLNPAASSATENP